MIIYAHVRLLRARLLPNLGLPENDIAIKLKTIVVEKFDPLVQYFKSGDGEADVKQVACLNVYVYSIYYIYIYLFKTGPSSFSSHVVAA